jgi:hypothetical protein
VPFTAPNPYDIIDRVKEVLQEYRAGLVQVAPTETSHADLAMLVREAVREEIDASRRTSSGPVRSEDVSHSHHEFLPPPVVGDIDQTEQISPKYLEKLVRDAVKAEMHPKPSTKGPQRPGHFEPDSTSADGDSDSEDDGELKRKVKLPMTKEEKCFHVRR